MPCQKGIKKRSSFEETEAKSCESNKIPEVKDACIVEAWSHAHHEDHIAGKGYNAMIHCNLVHKFILMPQVMKIPDAKAAEDKEWKEFERNPAWSLDKVKSKKEVIVEAQRDKKKVHFATLIDICNLKNVE